jgi:hypothetical protein
MASRGVHARDDNLILVLAGGRTVAEAASEVDISPRTVNRRLEDPAFRRRVEETRTAMFEVALGNLAGSLTEACSAVRSLLKSDSDQVKLGAARTIFDMTMPLLDSLTIDRRLAEIERRLGGGDGDHGAEPDECQPDFSLTGDVRHDAEPVGCPPDSALTPADLV